MKVVIGYLHFYRCGTNRPGGVCNRGCVNKELTLYKVAHKAMLVHKECCLSVIG